jgi:hypothetical protein
MSKNRKMHRPVILAALVVVVCVCGIVMANTEDVTVRTVCGGMSILSLVGWQRSRQNRSTAVVLDPLASPPSALGERLDPRADLGVALPVNDRKTPSAAVEHLDAVAVKGAFPGLRADSTENAVG